VNCKELADLGVSRDPTSIDSNARAFTVFRLEYAVSDDAGNPAVNIYRDVEIRDSTPPSLLVDVVAVVLDAATIYAEPAVSASDTLDGAYAFTPRYSSRIRSTVERADRLCNYATQFFDSSKLRDKGFTGECTVPSIPPPLQRAIIATNLHRNQPP
jgi:hypothetical protein